MKSEVDYAFRHFKNLESAQLIITQMLESTNCIFKEHDSCRDCGHEVHYAAEICPICNTKCPHTTIYGHLTFYDNKFFEDQIERKAKRKKMLFFGILALMLIFIALWIFIRH